MLKYNSPSNWFSLEYPDTWTLEEDSDCTTLYKASGGEGALQISAYEVDVAQSAEASLVQYFEDEGITISAIDLYQGDGQIVACSNCEKSGRFTKVCFLSKEKRVLFLTYNSDVAAKDSEREEVDEIIHSITIEI